MSLLPVINCGTGNPQKPLKGLWEASESPLSPPGATTDLMKRSILLLKTTSTVSELTATSSNAQPMKLNPLPLLTNYRRTSSHFFFWPYRFRVLAPPSVTPYRTNQSQGRLRRGLGARIGGMDKNHNADRRTEKWDRKSWTRVMKVALLVCPT